METPTDTYHHGDLRRALMNGALALVRERGLEALSLREVAARAGVSHAAPYHHFADKAAVVRALGFEGLRLLDERMARAESAAPDDPLERLIAIGVAYVLFMTEHREYFAVMGAPEMRDPEAQATAEDHGESWERLVRSVTACQEAGLLLEGDPVVLAIGMWSFVQGFADLWNTSAVPLMPQASGGVGQLAERVLRATLTTSAPNSRG